MDKKDAKLGMKVQILKQDISGSTGISRNKIGDVGLIKRLNVEDCQVSVQGRPQTCNHSRYEHIEQFIEVKPHIEKAKRFNSGKVEFHMLPELALSEVAKVGMFGGVKYPDEEPGQQNWRKGGDHSQYHNCRKRHQDRYHYGEDLDQDSKCHHLAHLAWNALTELELILTGNHTDDRPRVKLTKKLDEIMSINDEQKEAMKKYE